MKLMKLLGNIYMKVSRKNTDIFTHNRQQDEKFIQSFPEPKNDFERSYNQYLCQKWTDEAPIRYFFCNLASAILLVPVTAKYLWIGNQNQEQFKKYDAVLTSDFLKHHLPENFYGTYISQEFEDGSLVNEDIGFLREIRKRYPFSFYFRFKCLNRIAAYSDFIRKYCPRIVFCSAEYSFTSSVLTKYCEDKGVEHANLMHGEKLYAPVDTFSRFSKFYVWDQFYIDLFKSLRANKTNYIVSPIKLPDVTIQEKTNHAVYYLTLETDNELLRIKDALDGLGLDYKVRPHPIYETSGVKRIFSGKIEDPKTVDIWTSIANAGIVISLCSTVLYQAHLKGAKIMIDDISRPEKYKELFERDYIILSKPHLLLSKTME